MTELALDYPARALPARARTGATRSSRPLPQASRPLAGAAGAIGGLLGGALSKAARRPVRTLVQCAALGVGGLIIVNALGFQTARHPAPLGGQAPGQKSEMLVERPPLPPVRPSALAPTPAQPAAAPAMREAAPSREASIPAPRVSASAAQPATRTGDPIGDLLRGESGRSEVPRGDVPPAALREPARPVLAAQRALVKLGYTQVKADGVPGEATKSAIERFERERKLPITGQLNPKTLRELAAASGMKLD
jgi:hypothetical protein